MENEVAVIAEADATAVPAEISEGLPNFDNVSTDELVELSHIPEMIENVRAEVCKRLKERPERGNWLVFRYMLPASEADQIDAFDGLMAVCWNETEFRHVEVSELSREDEIEAIRDEIKTELVGQLYEFRDLGPSGIIQRGLNNEFAGLAGAVANAIRKHLRQQGSVRSVWLDAIHSDDEGSEEALVESLPNGLGDRTGDWADEENYDDVLEIVHDRQDEITEALGERCYQVLLVFLRMIGEDNGAVLEGNREQEVLYTSSIAEELRISERQARTYKARLRKAFRVADIRGESVLKEILDRLTDRSQPVGEYAAQFQRFNAAAAKPLGESEKFRSRGFRELAHDGEG